MGGDDPFSKYLPHYVELGKKRKPALCQPRSHGVKTEIDTYSASHERNIALPLEQRVLIECKVNAKPIYHALWTGEDYRKYERFFTHEGTVSDIGWTNIRGILGERIARRVTKYWAQHLSAEGRLGDLFRPDFSKHNSSEYIVRHSQRYILKIRDYPNMIILEDTGDPTRGKFGYEPRAELDGLFHYQYKDQQHILVLESKVEDLTIDPDHIRDDLFAPLQELFPQAKLWYIIFGQRARLITGPERHNRLMLGPANLYERLKERDVPAFFFTFNETKQDLNRITQYIVRQYMGAHILKRGAKRKLDFHAHISMSDTRIDIRDGDEHPALSFELNPETGEYRLNKNAFAGVLP